MMYNGGEHRWKAELDGIKEMAHNQVVLIAEDLLEAYDTLET